MGWDFLVGRGVAALLESRPNYIPWLVGLFRAGGVVERLMRFGGWRRLGGLS